ncbi:uncharacterized protein BcabD6B2_44670 [Babesia caballi]|uniref:Uncharacterized protein n=1 Tax=Babesia caballi TaxID=5871 RepID=A0AAV4LXT0_BABCB|nr:hypothetical protein, conserved [Babesia caballi]
MDQGPQSRDASLQALLVALLDVPLRLVFISVDYRAYVAHVDNALGSVTIRSARFRRLAGREVLVEEILVRRVHCDECAYRLGQYTFGPLNAVGRHHDELRPIARQVGAVLKLPVEPDGIGQFEVRLCGALS